MICLNFLIVLYLTVFDAKHLDNNMKPQGKLLHNYTSKDVVLLIRSLGFKTAECRLGTVMYMGRP